MDATASLLKTPLYHAHVAAGAKLVPFAGYEMPVHYRLGVLQEHLWTREKAGLFDVSHMGQAALVGSDHQTAARFLESLCPADILNLKPGQQRYTQLLNEQGGILDDLMVTRSADENGALGLVVNASCKAQDFAHIEAQLPAGMKLLRAADRALVALQGPRAAEALAKHVPGAAEISFMYARAGTFGDTPIHLSRSGYTGEDGYEISLKAEHVEKLWNALLQNPLIEPIGLGARDSLRLEAGLCLYGHDIDETTSPVEANLAWSIQKRRRIDGGFPGFARIQRELRNGPSRLRVGILPEGRAPAREGAEIVDPASGKIIGKVTSGGFGPSLNGPLAMGYVVREFSANRTPLHLTVRGKPLLAKVSAMPFVPHRYFKSAKAA